MDQFFTSYLPGFSKQHALQKEVEILDSNGRHLSKELKGVFLTILLLDIAHNLNQSRLLFVCEF